jgi:hypothetical protein
MFADPFFGLNPPSLSYSPYNSESIDVKTGSPDPANFAMTQRVCRLQYAKVAQPLHKLPELRKMDHRLVADRAKTRW